MYYDMQDLRTRCTRTVPTLYKLLKYFNAYTVKCTKATYVETQLDINK